MIPMPSSTQVWLATGYTDMRRYVERMIMQSPELTNPKPHLLSTA